MSTVELGHLTFTYRDDPLAWMLKTTASPIDVAIVGKNEPANQRSSNC